jgi:hypothetical protein
MGRHGARLVVAEARDAAQHRHEAVVLRPHLLVRASTPALPA